MPTAGHVETTLDTARLEARATKAVDHQLLFSISLRLL
jgi:hypothetical protein